MLDAAGKQAVVKDYGARYGLEVLIETGTYQGDMVSACLSHFTRIFSVELGEELARGCRERFRGWGHVSIAHGDSGAWLAPLLLLAGEPCLVWLDAHYSGGDTACGPAVTPVLAEMAAIGKLLPKGSVVLIDDARDFTPEKAHPPLDEFLGIVKKALPDYAVEVADDIIRITPKEH